MLIGGAVIIGIVLAIAEVRQEVGWLSSARQFSPAEPLTERENQILHLVVEGLTNPEVAARLTIEVSTVKTHVRSILRKLGMETRRGLFEEPR